MKRYEKLVTQQKIAKTKDLKPMAKEIFDSIWQHMRDNDIDLLKGEMGGRPFEIRIVPFDTEVFIERSQPFGGRELVEIFPDDEDFANLMLYLNEE